MAFFAKLSLFMLFYKLFKIQNFTRYAIIFGITISFIAYSSSLVACAITCAPRVGHPWDIATATRCGHASQIRGFLFGITNLVLDIFLLILPILVIYPLPMSVKKKAGILAIFIFGSL